MEYSTGISGGGLPNVVVPGTTDETPSSDRRSKTASGCGGGARLVRAAAPNASWGWESKAAAGLRAAP